MVDSDFSSYIDKIKRTRLNALAKRYAEFSDDFDCRGAAKKYDADVKKLYSAERNAAWAEKVLAFLQSPSPADVSKYVTVSDLCRELSAAARKVLSDKARSDENDRIALAAKWDNDIAELLSQNYTVEWCDAVERTYAKFQKTDVRVQALCKQSASFVAVCRDLKFIRQALEIDKRIVEACSGQKSGEAFWNSVDKIKKEYDGLGGDGRKYVKETAKLNAAVAEAERQCKAAAGQLDSAYMQVKSVSRSKTAINNALAFIAQWNKSPQQVKSRCKYATAQSIAALNKLCATETDNLDRDAANRKAAEKADGEIAALCGALSTGDEAYRLRVDKLKTEFDNLPSAIRSLCQRSWELDKAVKEAFAARKKEADYLEAEYRRVSVSHSTRELIADGGKLIQRWATVPKTVKAMCRAVSDKDITNLSKFFAAETKRLDEEDRKLAIRLAQEAEMERKRKEAEEAARKRKQLDSDINESYMRAKRGDAEAMFRLAGYYFTGNGVTKSYYDAFEWYEKAAKKGHTGAWEKLGDCYYYGYGVEQSYAKAEKCYKKAAKR